jgi:ABC-2 type transport system permease protein
VTTLTGFGRFARFVLRRDRVRLLVWVVAITLMTLASAASLPAVYPTQPSLDGYVQLFGNNPALIAFAGPGYGFDDPNLGLVLVNETQLNAMIALGLMSIFLVTRNTRAEEESERADLVRASVVGRHAPAASAAAVIGGANLLVGLLCGLGFIALDYEFTGSLALASSLTCAGLLFAGIAALAAQLTSSGRATLGIASSVLGVAFAIRAIGDVADNGLSWLSPIGWAQAIQAYADERWWVLGLCLAAFVGLLLGAFWLSTRRDLGAGILPQRLGSAHAERWMTRPVGFAFRLQRGALLGWTVALFLMGFLYGSIANDLEQMLEENPFAAEMFSAQAGASLTDQFLATGMTQLALIAGACGIATALRLATEEAAGRAEPILAGPMPRSRWAGSHVLMAAAGSLVGLVAAGFGAGLAYALVIGDPGQIPRLIGSALVNYPGVLVLTGVAVVFFGAFPAIARVAWAALAVAFVTGFFGDLFKFPDWVRWISPFEHTPGLPAEDLAFLPLLLLLIVAAALIAFGARAFRVRDLRTD